MLPSTLMLHQVPGIEHTHKLNIQALSCTIISGAVCLQIKYGETPASVLSAAKQLGGDKASAALELVGYDQEVQAAIKYVFGNAFICQVGVGIKYIGHHQSIFALCISTR